MPSKISRRRFLARSAAAGAVAFGVHSFPSSMLRAEGPNERLNIASVGTSKRAGANLEGVASQNIVALCDIDESFLGAVGERFPQARRYSDFRVMLEKEAKNLDAVLVSTPDHTHAPAAAMALRLGKHVYCEKPLTHTIFEARTLAKLAAQHKLVTQMGTQIHAGDNYREVVELIQTGAIGKVREAHVWVGSDYSGGKLVQKGPAPEHIHWDLWLGPAKERPYAENVHPFNWRWFWDYGTGSLGDFGCHYIDLVQWALKLGRPTSCRAEGPPVDPIATTAGLSVAWEFPARDDMPPVKLTWHDGGKKPEIASTLKRQDGSPIDWGSAQLFVGEKGMLISDYGKHILLPEDKFVDFKKPEPFIPRSVGHHREWVDACKSGGETTCNFEYGGRLTETVLLGTVAYRLGKPIQWDGENLRAVGLPEADALIHKEYRSGWTL